MDTKISPVQTGLTQAAQSGKVPDIHRDGEFEKRSADDPDSSGKEADSEHEADLQTPRVNYRIDVIA